MCWSCFDITLFPSHLPLPPLSHLSPLSPSNFLLSFHCTLHHNVLWRCIVIILPQSICQQSVPQIGPASDDDGGDNGVSWWSFWWNMNILGHDLGVLVMSLSHKKCLRMCMKLRFEDRGHLLHLGQHSNYIAFKSNLGKKSLFTQSEETCHVKSFVHIVW